MDEARDTKKPFGVAEWDVKSAYPNCRHMMVQHYHWYYRVPADECAEIYSFYEQQLGCD